MKLLIRTLLTFLCFLVVTQAHSQAYKANNFYDAAIGIGKRQYSVALGWSHLYSLGKKKHFKVGYGVRFTKYFGNDQYFITAPARLTSRQTGPQVLFSKTYNESLDTVTFFNAQVNMLNLVIHLEHTITKRLDLGFNIDAVGFSFGKRQQGRLQSSIKPSDLSEEQSGKPTTLNALLVSDNDIGSLNSELYLKYWLNDKLALKGAFGFLFAEYTTDNKLIFDNDRFRNKVSLAVLGITYNPFRKQI